MKIFNQNIMVKSLKQILEITLILVISFIEINAQTPAIINIDSTHQIIRGFGAANILPWRADMTQDEIQTAFGTGDGQLGFSILRIRIPSDEGSFSLNVPTAQAAHSMGVTIIASPWSPPASMKTNNNIVSGELKESSYAEYAAYLKNFADYMNTNGVPLYAVSLQNEPDAKVSYESCDWNGAQFLNFMKNYAQSIGYRIMMPESQNFLWSLSDPTLNDSVACSHLDIVGGHIYGGGLYEYPLALSKGKEVWMTEHLTESQHSANIWSYAMDVAMEMQQVMKANMSAYIWWYIVRYYGPIGDGEKSISNPNENFSPKGAVTKKGYVMSQFSRFIRPGYYRIESTYQPQSGIYITAYRDSSSAKEIIVVINKSTQSLEQKFVLQNFTTDMVVPYITSNSKNCVKENSISVVDGSFTATLDGSSITTFISGENNVSVDETSTVPGSYNLYQNYPNPFNPTTTIRYSIAGHSAGSQTLQFVSLEVYDMLGRKIASLVQENKSPGNYEVVFNGTGLASGIYLCRLTVSPISNPLSSSFSETKKLILMK